MSASERLGDIVAGGDPEICCSGLQTVFCSFESTVAKHSEGARFLLYIAVWKDPSIWDSLGHFMDVEGPVPPSDVLPIA